MEKNPIAPRGAAKFKYGARGEYLVTAPELELLRLMERRYMRGQISYRTYLAEKRRLLTLEQTGRPTTRKAERRATPWKKIKIVRGGLPELGKR